MSVSKLLADVPILFSTQTYLAWFINEHFYGRSHYVWCAPIFNAKELKEKDQFYGIPRSSSPFEIYKAYKEDSSRGDLHSDCIAQNKRGLLKGASFNLEKGIITESEYKRIQAIIDNSPAQEFRPYMYLIPKLMIPYERIHLVDVEESANPLSYEFQVHDLHSNEFTTIQF